MLSPQLPYVVIHRKMEEDAGEADGLWISASTKGLVEHALQF